MPSPKPALVAKPGPGRPPVPRKGPLKVVSVKITAAEKRKLRMACARNDLASSSEFMSEALKQVDSNGDLSWRKRPAMAEKTPRPRLRVTAGSLPEGNSRG